MKRILFLFCSLVWFAACLAILLFLWQYLAAGSGLQDSGYVYLIFIPVFVSGSVALGFIHVLGLFMFALLSFAMSFSFYLLAFDAGKANDKNPPSPPSACI